MKINRILLSILACATLFGLSACQKGNDAGGNQAVSDDCFFIEQQLAYNLTSNPTIIVPVARLAKAAEAVVNVSSTGSDLFTVPSSVKIENLRADLHYTYLEGEYPALRTNIQVYPFTEVDDSVLPDHQSIYEQFKAIITNLDQNIQIGGV